MILECSPVCLLLRQDREVEASRRFGDNYPESRSRYVLVGNLVLNYELHFEASQLVSNLSFAILSQRFLTIGSDTHELVILVFNLLATRSSNPFGNTLSQTDPSRLTSKMASKSYNVGVIGYGMSAKVFHIPLITVVPYFKLYAVVQRSPKPNDDAEKDHPGIKSYRTTEEMVKDPTVDVVIVTTAPDLHLSLTKLALNAGKHGLLPFKTSGRLSS